MTMEAIKNELDVGSSVVSGGKHSLEPIFFIPGSHRTKRISNHTALSWKYDLKEECVRLHPKKHLSFFPVTLSNTVTDTKKKTLFYVYWFCTFLCSLDFKREIIRIINIIRMAEDLWVVLKMCEVFVIFLHPLLQLVPNLLLCIFTWSHHYWHKVFFLVSPSGTAFLCFSAFKLTSLEIPSAQMPLLLIFHSLVPQLVLVFNLSLIPS